MADGLDKLNTLLPRLRAKDASLTRIECVFYAKLFLFYFFMVGGGAYFASRVTSINHDSLNFTNIGNAGLGRIVACLPGNTHLQEI